MKNPAPEGILLVDKARGSTSFHLVSILRRLTRVEKIGHAGTLDPFATGVMVMLIGRNYTRLSDQFLTSDKQYLATLHLGIATDSFDIDGEVVSKSDLVPTLEEVQKALLSFQGEILQVPPMFSAKKVQGKKLYDLARKGLSIEREPVKVTLTTRLLRYEYPELEIEVSCSKGTYIRSIADDLGKLLGSFAHLSKLSRTRSGAFTLSQCLPQEALANLDINPHLLRAPHV
jgi:tRNA pseudouridine55 synthase